MKSSRPPALTPRASLRARDPGIALDASGGVPGVFTSFVWQNLAVTVWCSAPNMESLAAFGQRSRAFCAAHPEGFSSVHVMIPGGTAMPTSEVRAELSRIINESAPHVAAGAALIAGDGFWASALRGLVTALTLLMPRSLAPRIYAQQEPLADWLAPLHSERTGVQVQASEVLQVLRMVQSSVARSAA